MNLSVTGHLQASRSMSPQSLQVLNGIASTPRYARDVQKIGTQYGVEGEFYANFEEETVIQPKRPPLGQPSTLLEWYPSEDGMQLFYDENCENISMANLWLMYLVAKFYQPQGIYLNGEVIFKNQETGTPFLHLVVVNNQVNIK